VLFQKAAFLQQFNSMTKIWDKYEGLQIAAIFLVMNAIPMVLSMFLGYNTLGGYLSPLLLLMFTYWLYKRKGESLNALGLNTDFNNSKLLLLGLLIGVLFSTTVLMLQVWNNNLTIHYNKNANWLLIYVGLFFFVQGVLNEELIFRGYCFKTTVEKIGITKANLIFGFLFVVWHWISFNAWGNMALMLGLFTTAFGHLLFSTSLLRSGTLYLPIGIHIGNNWAGKFLFATGMQSSVQDGPVDDAVFYVSASQNLDNSLFHVLTNYGLTVGTMLFFTWAIWKYQWKQVSNAK
jgi:membrane protease YdiL (CAAX protease family)